jgi:ABC-2 type transport system ATP-binding protein
LLLGLLNNQKGDIEIFGEHLHANRINILKKIGSLIETPSLYGHLTAKKTWKFIEKFTEHQKQE